MLIMAKNDSEPGHTDMSGVDMDKIKQLMGPLPNEGAPEPPQKGKKKGRSEAKRANTGLASAAAEANEALKATMPSLGDANIQNIPDDPILDAEGRPVTPAVEQPEPSDIIEPTEENAGQGTSAAPEVEEPLPEIPDDPVTSQAVDEIVKAEGDAVLKAEDEKLETVETKSKPRHKGRFKQWLKDLWAKPATRWVILGLVVVLLLAAGLIPGSRYFVLNNVGVRSTMSLKVMDSGTLQPLKNVQVTAAGVSALTDSNGVAKLEHLKLGPTTLIIDKP